MLTKAKITFKIVIFNRFICTMWLWSEKQLNVLIVYIFFASDST